MTKKSIFDKMGLLNYVIIYMSEKRQIFTNPKRELEDEALKVGQKEIREAFKIKAIENRNEKYDLEVYGDKIKDLIAKYDAAISFSLIKVATDEEANILWLLEFHGPEHLKGGKSQIIKSFQGYIKDVYSQLETYLLNEFERDAEEEKGQNGKRKK